MFLLLASVESTAWKSLYVNTRSSDIFASFKRRLKLKSKPFAVFALLRHQGGSALLQHSDSYFNANDRAL